MPTEGVERTPLGEDELRPYDGELVIAPDGPKRLLEKRVDLCY